MSEEKSIQYFQWIKGDNAGKVVEWEGSMTVTPEGKPSLIFKDGTTGEESLLNDFFVEVASPNQWDLVLLPETSIAPSQPNASNPTQPIIYDSQEDPDIIVARPPAGWVPPKRAERVKADEPIKETQSPIFKLLADSKKTDTVVNVSVDTEVPSAELMRVLSDSYENGQEEVLKYLASTLDLEEIKMQIARQIWRHTINDNKKSRKRANETA
jgi:hypothetical protein